MSAQYWLTVKQRAWGLADATLAVVAVVTLAGFGGGWAWWLDLAAHFRIQYLVLLGGLALASAIARRWIPAAMALGLGLLNCVAVSPRFLGELAPAVPERASLTVVFVNVHTENRRADLVGEYLTASNADVVVLAEVSEWWLGQLTGLTNTHPHRVAAPRDDNFGIALFSRLPLLRGDVAYLGATGLPSVEAEIEFDGQPVLLLGIHPLPPIGAERTRRRDEQLAAVARRVHSAPLPVVLVGDLNTTPWAPSFQRFVRESGLRDTFGARGYQPTWPAGRFPLWLPLDHCLISRELAITGRDVGPNVGSDHYPLRVEIRGQ